MDHRKPIVSPPRMRVGGAALVVASALGLAAPYTARADGAWVLWTKVHSITTGPGRQTNETAWELEDAYPTHATCVAAQAEKVVEYRIFAESMASAGIAEMIESDNDGTVAWMSSKAQNSKGEPGFVIVKTPKCLPESVDPREPAQR